MLPLAFFGMAELELIAKETQCLGEVKSMIAETTNIKHRGMLLLL